MGLTVAYHSACSMQHGQKITDEPKKLLRAAGFVVKDVAEGHICCGSAGVYNILQPELAGQLRDRKTGHIARTKPDIVATGNIGCITQIAKGFADRARAGGSAAAARPAHGRASRLGARRASPGKHQRGFVLSPHRRSFPRNRESSLMMQSRPPPARGELDARFRGQER